MTFNRLNKHFQSGNSHSFFWTAGPANIKKAPVQRRERRKRDNEQELKCKNKTFMKIQSFAGEVKYKK